MTTNVAVVGQVTPFKQIVHLLEEQHHSAAPVVDEKGRVVGVMSDPVCHRGVLPRQ